MLGVGAYRTNEGKPLILDCVKQAEKIVFDKGIDHEYSPIDGHAGFRAKASELAFGAGSDVLTSKRNATMQSLSGTGALRVGFEFLRN